MYVLRVLYYSENTYVYNILHTFIIVLNFNIIMEGVEDGYFDIGSFAEALDVHPLQDAAPKDPLGRKEGDGDASLSPPKPVALDGSAGK